MPPSRPSLPVRKVARTPHGRLNRELHRLMFGRPFTAGPAHRVLVLFGSDRISYASAYPFLAQAESFLDTHDAQVRLFPVARALRSGLPRGLAEPTHVVAQAWLTDPPERHAALARLLDRLPQGTVRAFLDTFSNCDIRLAARLPGLDLYFKKSLFVDRSAFLRPTYGHTNLTEYYGRLYGLPDEMTDWQVPADALPRLRLAPNFLTSPDLMHGFLEGPRPPGQRDRDIDLHARLGGTRAEGWYGEMRRHAAKAVDAVAGCVTATGSGISRAAFLDELRRAKVCFSPFGYGEVCWRDIEAIAMGAVLLKPDMGHLETTPDLYRDEETYVACAWDFSDLEEKLRALLADPARRDRMASMAWQRARDYLRADGPVEAFGPLFETVSRQVAPVGLLQGNPA